MKNFTRETGCGCCGGNNKKVHMRISGTFIIRCFECGCHYVSPKYESDELQKKIQYWAEMDVNDQIRLDEYFSDGVMEFNVREIRKISGFTGNVPGCDILDVGCSVGSFLSTAKSLGMKVTGLEIGKHSARYARNIMGLNVFEGDLLSSGFPDSSFDIVTLYEVIEHLENPASAVEEIWRILKTGGVMAVSTPNLDSLTAAMLKDKWWVINCPDEHISLFTPSTICSFVEKKGFDILECRTSGFDIINAIKTIRNENTQCRGVCETRANIRNAIGDKKLVKRIRHLKQKADLMFTSGISPLKGRGERIFLYARKTGKE